MTDGSPSDPCRVSLVVDGVRHPAVALELTGSGAALCSRRVVAPDDDVTIEIDWPSGASTSLSARVLTVAPLAGEQSVAHVRVRGVCGAWRPWLEYLGPLALAS